MLAVTVNETDTDAETDAETEAGIMREREGLKMKKFAFVFVFMFVFVLEFGNRIEMLKRGAGVGVFRERVTSDEDCVPSRGIKEGVLVNEGCVSVRERDGIEATADTRAEDREKDNTHDPSGAVQSTETANVCCEAELPAAKRREVGVIDKHVETNEMVVSAASVFVFVFAILSPNVERSPKRNDEGADTEKTVCGCTENDVGDTEVKSAASAPHNK